MFHILSGGPRAGLTAFTLLTATGSLTGPAPAWAATAADHEVAVVAPVDDRVLDAFLGQAVASHPSIASARATIRAAGADIRSARWQAFPSFSVQGLWLDQTPNSRQASLVIDQPIWSGGRISSAIKRAKAQNQAAISAYREAVLQVMVDVSQNYRDYHRLDRKLEILRASLAEHRTLLETMERRVAQEVSPLADLELARSRVAQIEQQVTSTVAQRRSALQRLRELVGDPGLDPGPPPPDGPLADLDGSELVARTLAFDPMRQRLMAEADAARAEAASARASILPQLSGQYSYDQTNGHRIGLVLKAQSSGGLSSFSNASAARERQDAAELRIASTERDLRQRTISDLADYDAARERMTSTGTARTAAERVTQSYMRQFVSGRRTWLDVMNAVREATTAQGDAVDASANAGQARDRLLMRSGSWPFPAEGGQP